MKKTIAVCLWLWIILIIIPSCFSKQSHDIKTIKSFSEVDFNKIEPNAMVIFDVDGVLINPASKVFWGKIEKENGEWIGQLFSNVFEKAKHPLFFYLSKMMEKETPILIEPTVVNIINNLQNRGIMVIALTSTSSGSCFSIPSMPTWRFNKLKSVGIDFNKANLPNIEFINLPAKNPEHDGKYPVFFNGILYTSDTSKGTLIEAFFENTKLKPSRVIFFDDRLSNLKSVSQAMHKLAIPFSGYEYLGESYLLGKLDKDIASYQLHYVVEHEQWLNEEEVQALLEQSNNNHLQESYEQ